MTDKEKLIKIKLLADKMSDTAFNMTTDASLLRKAMDDYHQFIINEYHKEEQIIKELQEEPVSEELEEACEQLAENARKHKAETSSPFFNQTDYKQGVMDGSKWQLEKMMANAIEGGCFSYKNGFVHISCDIDEHLTDIKIGDKVKVIVIKED